jgi:hypothetical protein
MNIFKVLASTPRSSFPENPMSATLAWLLKPNEDHNLGPEFLSRFLKKLEVDCDSGFEVVLEYSVKTGFIDIVLLRDDLVIAIENKIYSKSAQKEKQLVNQYKGLKNRLADEGKTSHILSVFLIPEAFTAYTDKVFLALEKEPRAEGDKVRKIIWKTDICKIMKDILDDTLANINETSRQLLQNLEEFIKNNFAGYEWGKRDESASSNYSTGTMLWNKILENDSVKSVGVQGGIGGLLAQGENLGKLQTKKFQVNEEKNIENPKWLDRKLFLRICEDISNNFEKLDWMGQDLILSSENIYRIAMKRNKPFFIGIKGGLDGLKNLIKNDAEEIRSKRWGVSKNKLTSQWISSKDFIETVNSENIFNEAPKIGA